MKDQSWWALKEKRDTPSNIFGINMENVGMHLCFLISLRKATLNKLTSNVTWTVKRVILSVNYGGLCSICSVKTIANQRPKFFVADKIQAFKKKLVLWTKRTKEKRMGMFPLLSDIFEGSLSSGEDQWNSLSAPVTTGWEIWWGS